MVLRLVVFLLWRNLVDSLLFLLLLDWNVNLLTVWSYLKLVLSWVNKLLLLIVLGLLGLKLCL